MGNWRRVEIIGTCDAKDVPKLAAAVNCSPDFQDLHCLSHYRSICGLPAWAGTKIQAVGNLAERDYTLDDVVRQLDELLKVAPSLNVKIHVGGDYEAEIVEGTVSVRDGKAVLGPPEAERVPSITEGQRIANIGSAFRRPAG